MRTRSAVAANKVSSEAKLQDNSPQTGRFVKLYLFFSARAFDPFSLVVDNTLVSG